MYKGQYWRNHLAKTHNDDTKYNPATKSTSSKHHKIKVFLEKYSFEVFCGPVSIPELYATLLVYEIYRGCHKMYTHFKRCYLCITFRS